MTGEHAKLNKLLLIAGLVYLVWPQLRQAFASLGVQLPDMSRLLPVPQNVTEAGLLPAGPPAAGPGTGGGSVVGAIGGTATSVIGAASAAGASLATIGLATGIGAAAVIIAWGVMKQGWFRGGQEGIVVNPARDHFLAHFAPLDYMRDSSNPPGFYGLSWVLTELGEGPRFAAVAQAHTKAQLEAAVAAVQGVIAANKAKFAQLWEYARRDPSAPQRAVTAAA
jgi:hypothetical protein